MTQWFLNLFRRRPVIKIGCLLVSMFLWIYVMNEQNPVIDGSVQQDITLENAPSGYSLEMSDDSASVEVRALRSMFLNTDLSTVKITADVSEIKDGENVVKLRAVPPAGFEVMSISPDAISVTAHKKIAQDMPITPLMTGSPASDMVVAGLDISALQARLIGVQKDIARVTRVMAFIPLTGRSETFEQDILLLPINSGGSLVDNVTVEPASVTATVELARGLTKKILVINPNFTGSLPDGYVIDKVTVTPEKLEVAASAEAMRGVNALSTRKVDLGTLTNIPGVNTVITYIQPIRGVAAAVSEVTLQIDVKKRDKN